MAVILTILKIIGILLLVVLGLVVLICASVLFVPVRYFVECRSGRHVNLGLRVSWLFRMIQIRKGVSESRIKIYIFGINIKNFKNPFKKEKKEYDDVHVTHSRVHLVDDLYDEAKKQDDALREEERRQRVHVETDYEEEKEDQEKVSAQRKKSFSFDKISSIITFIRDYENKSGLRKIRKECASLIRYIMPDRIQGRISFGTGDPCTTGWLLGVISMFPVAYAEGLTISPDFEEKVFAANGYMKGKIRVFYFLRLFLRGYLDDDINRCIRRGLKQI